MVYYAESKFFFEPSSFAKIERSHTHILVISTHYHTPSSYMRHEVTDKSPKNCSSITIYPTYYPSLHFQQPPYQNKRKMNARYMPLKHAQYMPLKVCSVYAFEVCSSLSIFSVVFIMCIHSMCCCCCCSYSTNNVHACALCVYIVVFVLFVLSVSGVIRV